MTTIKLSQKVRVSDPCYDNDVWCKTSLSNVYPGEYNVKVDKSDLGDWGNRVHKLTVIHKGYVVECADESSWTPHSDIGVDSGQAGIFCESSYRNDEIAAGITAPELITPFVIPFRNEGDVWYNKMCNFTLGAEQCGVYDTGVVTSSGVGDGMYPLDVVYNDNNEIVGMRVTYLDDTEDEDEGDCCGVCGGEIEEDGECAYCCEETNDN
jgi:hypothetical protein